MANHLIISAKPFVKLLTGQALMASSSMALQLVAGLTWSASEFGIWSGYWLWMQLAEAIITAIVINPLQTEIVNHKNYNPTQFILLLLGLLFGLLLPISGLLFSANYSVIISIASFGYLLVVSNRKLSILNGYMNKNTNYEYSIAAIQFICGVIIFFTKSNSNTIWLVLGIGYLIIAAFGYNFRFNIYESKILASRLLKKGIPQLLASIVTWYAGNGLMLSAGVLLGTSVLGNIRFVQSLLGIWNLLFQTMENYLPTRLYNQYLSDIKYLFIKGLTKTSLFLALGLVIIQGSLILLLSYGIEIGILPYFNHLSIELLIKFSALYLIIAIALPWRIAYRIMNRNWEQLLISIVLASINLVFGNYFIINFQENGVLILLSIQPILYLVVLAFIIKFNPVPLCKLYILSWARPTLTE